jgi:serine/threonine protein kinase/WD40 repeat protein
MMGFEDLFFAVREMPLAGREAFLVDACGSDLELRDRLDKMLAKAIQADAFFEIAGDGESTSVRGPEVETNVGTRIGRYELLEKIGEGGFGSVYRAEQREPVRREVALKLIKLGMDTEQVIARFEAERQALALMSHPHIATVLDAGATETGRPYFVMDLVRGIPITHYCTQHRFSLGERLSLFIEICKAVQHAHHKGIIHRDLKPSNILVTQTDGTHVPKVIDFGIAKSTLKKLTDYTLHTAAHQFIGTPAYMSPEQADGVGMPLDTRADVYALGALLYELITGNPPFKLKFLPSLTEDEVRRIIREEDPVRPSSFLASRDHATLAATARHFQLDPKQMARAIRGELDWIVMKAMEKDRNRRYGSALALADDVERHLNDEPVTAAAPGVLYQWGKVLRHHRKAVVTLGLVLASLVLGLTLAISQAKRANASQHKTAAALSEIEGMQKRLEHENYRANIRLAQALIKSRDFGNAASLLWSLPVGLRSWEWGYVMAQVPTPETTGWDTGHENLSSMVISDGGRRVITGGLDHRVIAWNWRSGKKYWEHLCAYPVSQVVTDPTGRYVAVAMIVQPWKSSLLFILDQATGKPVYQAPSSAWVVDLWWFSDGLYVADHAGTITRLASGSWEILHQSQVPALPPTRIRGWYPADAGTPPGILVIRNQDPEVLDLHTLATRTRFDLDSDADLYLAHADAGNDWAVASSLHTVYRLLPDGTSSLFYKHGSGIRWLVALDRDRLVVAGDDEIALVRKDGSVAAQWETPVAIAALAALPGGRLLVADRTGYARLYDPDRFTGATHLQQVEYGAECRNVFFAPSGRQVGFMAWHKKEAHLIDAASGGGGAIATLPTPDYNPEIDTTTDVPGFYPPTGELVCHTPHSLEFYEIEADSAATLTRSLALPFTGDFFRFDAARNRILFVPQCNGPSSQIMSIHSIDLDSGITTPIPLKLGGGTASTRVRAFDLTPDGEVAAISQANFSSTAEQVNEWAVVSTATGEVLLHGQSQVGVPIVALHPSGKHVAVGYPSGSIEVWDTLSGERQQRFQNDGRPITGMRFAGIEGDRLFTGGGDLRLRLWDWAYGEEVLAIPTTTAVRAVALSADGMAVAHGGYQPAITVHFALPWWFELGDPQFYQALSEISPGK